MVAARVRRTAVCLAASAVLVAAGAPTNAMAATDSEQRARLGVGYLASRQEADGSIPAFSAIGSTADAVISMVAARRGAGNIMDAVRYLSRQVANGAVTEVGQRAQVALAVVAAGRSPRDFGGRDLIAQLRGTERPNGRYGGSTDVYEHALAMLALAAAGAGPSRAATAWLARAQCGDGGWQNDDPPSPDEDRHCLDRVDPGGDFFTSDTNTTGVAVQALEVGRGSAVVARDPFGFFAAIRDPRFGGWGYTWGFETTDANSTALVIDAYAAAGRRLPTGALAALKALQYRRCGAWAYSWADDGRGGVARTPPDVGATIQAIQGVLQRPLPPEPLPVSRPAPDTNPC
jgi:hypothetical protein